MNKIFTALLAIIAFSTVVFAGGYNSSSKINMYNGCQVQVSIKVLSEFSDDEQNAQVRYKYSKENCAEKVSVSFTGLTGGDLLYKKKRKNIYLKSDSHNSIETGFNFKVSQKIGEYTKSENVYIGIEMGTSNFECDPVIEALGLCIEEPECDSVMQSLGICTIDATVNMVVTQQLSVNNEEAKVEFIVDEADNNIEKIEITEIKMNIENLQIIDDDNNYINSFPQTISNGDNFTIISEILGQKIKLESYKYIVYYTQYGDEVERLPKEIQVQTDLNLGVYTD